MNSIYIKERHHEDLNCLYKANVVQKGYQYEVTIYMDGYTLETGQIFDDVADAVVYVNMKLPELCGLFTRHRL